MAKIGCKETTLDSFYSNFLYEQVIPKGHFLVKLKKTGERYKIERKFGEVKRWHGFSRCHYNRSLLNILP